MSLPNGNHTFIGYAKTPQAAQLPDGAAATVRAQVWVCLYEKIKIKDVQIGGRDQNSDTVQVTFDAASVGLDNDFRAFLDPNDAAVAMLQAAAESGDAIQVAIEKPRKQRAKSTKEPISPLAPINQLRGAHRDGTSADMNASRENVRNVVALVNGVPTGSITSDEAEWALLAANREGLIAPAGWEAIDSDEWGAPVAIRLSGAATATPSASGFDEAVLAGLLTRLINEQVGSLISQNLERLRSDILDVLPGATAAPETGTPGRRVTPDVFVEGKPWDIRTSNGKLNLGGYLPTRYRYTFNDARDILAAAGHSIDDADVWTLVEQLLAITDQVQAQSYGLNTPADRTASSYGEAAFWVKGAVSDLARDGRGVPSGDRAEWADMVIAVAVDRMSQVRDRATEHLAQRGSAKQRQAEQRARQQPTQTSPSNAALAPAVLKGAADLAQRMQHNAAALRKAAVDAQTRGQGVVPFAWQEIDGTIHVVVADTLDTTDGWNIQPFTEVLHVLYNRAMKLHPETAPTLDESAPAPQQRPAQQATPPQQAAPTSAPTATRPKYPESVAAILGGIVNARSLDELSIQYHAARDSALLDAPIAARAVDGTGTEIGFPGQEGFAAQPLSRVLDRFRRALQAQEAEAPARPDASTPASAPAPEQPTSTPVPAGAATEAPAGSGDEGVESDDADEEAAHLEELVGDWLQQVNAAKEAGDVTTVEQVLNEVKGLELTNTIVQIGNDQGPLGGWLTHVLGSMRETALATA